MIGRVLRKDKKNKDKIAYVFEVWNKKKFFEVDGRITWSLNFFPNFFKYFLICFSNSLTFINDKLKQWLIFIQHYRIFLYNLFNYIHCFLCVFTDIIYTKISIKYKAILIIYINDTFYIFFTKFWYLNIIYSFIH